MNSKITQYLNLVDAEDESVTRSILLTSDIHTTGLGSIDADGCSIIIIAGDIMGAGMDSDDAGKAYVEREIYPFCEEHSDKQIIFTAGNHDKYLFRLWERGESLRVPANMHYLIDRSATIDGLKVYGTPWCTKDRPGRFEASSHGLTDRFRSIPYGLDILISHSPPFVPGEKVDVYDGYHDGSPELTEEILKKRPRLCVCGHVHGGSREPIMLGSTKVMNVARVKGDRSKESHKPVSIRFTYER